MQSILAVFSKGKTEDIKRRLALTASICQETVPSIEGPLTAEVKQFSEVAGGWIVVRPKSGICRSRIDQAENRNVSALVIGHILGTNAPAAAVIARYEANGIPEVKELNGSFSAIVLDKKARRAYIAGDTIGHNSLRWMEKNGTLCISSHDLPLAAWGIPNIEVDELSILSTITLNWSLGGTPLLKEISTIDAHKWLEWQDGRTVQKSRTCWTKEESLALSDKKSISRTVDAAVDSLRSGATQLVAPYSRITVSLTAGIDSRLVLALLPLSNRRSEVRAETSGDEASTDVVWAKRLAKQVHVPHRISVPDEFTTEDALRHLELLAFAMNGDTNGCWALSRLEAVPKEQIRLTGVGGEIFRGYYYPEAHRSKDSSAAEAEVINRLLKKANSRLTLLQPGVGESSAGEGLRQRLSNVFAGYNTYSDNLYDKLDLFYILERCGRWGAMSNRRHWYSIGTPLCHQKTIRLFLRLPSQMRRRSPLHPRAVWRFLPKSVYAMPINGWRPIFISESGKWSKKAAFVYKNANKQLRRLSNRIRPQATGTSEQVRSHLMAEHLGETIRDRLLSSDSILTTILPRNALLKNIEDFISKPNEESMQLVGFMLSIDAWYRQIRAVDQRRIQMRGEN